jgi:hypothetical protein
VTATNQNFEVYAGDDAAVVITVTNDAGTAIDLHDVQEIEWKAYDGAGATVLTRTKTGGDITFVTSGTDGQISIALAAADTDDLAGWYWHSARLTDASGNKSTFEQGRLLAKVRELGD